MNDNKMTYNVFTTSAVNPSKMIMIASTDDINKDISMINFDSSKGKITTEGNDTLITYNDGTRTLYKQVIKRAIIKEELKTAVEKNNYILMKCELETAHPDDWYLYSVLAYSPTKNEWVAWVYNASFGGLYHGKYCNDLEECEKYYNDRIQ